MITLNRIYCFVVFFINSHICYGAVLNVLAILNYYNIKFDHVISANVYQCLVNRNSQSCMLHLKDYRDYQFNVSHSTQDLSDEMSIPQYTCTFGGNDSYGCFRTVLDLPSKFKESCSQYHFIISWRSREEYFIDDSNVNCSIDSTTFAYRTTSTKITTSRFRSPVTPTLSPRSNKNITKESSSDSTGILLAVAVSSSTLMFISVIVIVYLCYRLHKRKQIKKSDNYDFTEKRQQDSHYYEKTCLTDEINTYETLEQKM